MKYDFVFCVLCYRSTVDLEHYLQYVQRVRGLYRVIVVDSYFDDDTKNTMAALARSNDCDFLSVENKGYGAGNNVAIAYARQHYDFQYLVITNPDIEFLAFDVQCLTAADEEYIIGPAITTLTGKKQNPYKPYRFWLINGVEYWAFCWKSRLLLYVGIVLNKLLREFFCFWYGTICQKRARTYSLHGSCMLIGCKALERLVDKDGRIYDENMFLFGEEEEIAYRAIQTGIFLYFDPQLHIKHYEDGSMKLISNRNDSYQESISYRYCYKKWNS